MLPSLLADILLLKHCYEYQLNDLVFSINASPVLHLVCYNSTLHNQAIDQINHASLITTRSRSQSGRQW